ncbi:MAG: hypothetical protein IH589_09765 [Anaerolineales bacterium]|nr:hypothetical protein [Anaerolineales bacterium]
MSESSEGPVFLLGAGASKDAFFPLVKDITDIEYLRFLENGIKYVDKHRDNIVSSAVIEMCQSFTNNDRSFELALYESFRDQDKTTYNRLLEYYEFVLFTAETYSGMVPTYGAPTGSIMDYGVGHYFLFSEFLKSLPSATVISFNHDLSLEHGSEWKGFTYGGIHSHLHAINGDSIKFGNTFTYLKLHGSFNFIYCEKCETITYSSDYLWSIKFPCPNCGANTHPWYVPPLKKKDYKPFATLWKDAATALKQTNLIMIIGYSFPDYDEEARRLLTENLNPDAWIVLIDTNPLAICKKLASLPNPRKHYFEVGFRDFMVGLETNLDALDYLGNTF